MYSLSIPKYDEHLLYAILLCQETGLALEQHLHRGRALAAFNQLLGSRVQKLKSDGLDKGQPSALLRGQATVQSDVQALLSSLTLNEESVLSSVRSSFFSFWISNCKLCSEPKAYSYLVCDWLPCPLFNSLITKYGRLSSVWMQALFSSLKKSYIW